ncbi:type II secretion system F family protein [Terrisporobacter mayombei]|uniref:Type II secretion system protein F n=1 Tax=Terrisporobacter mayombei TaxID=1541 RepID=A0ABY9Q469_9FIRM|nr:type II secretion system F family protein [Terrisporobacter mayombei]MCC3869063.1 type II secretion system F family protein [Terrisporobacter mayombei]WMT82803.1 Type II secretion system protein F [Terrisporobacter mayombei]
MYKCIIYDEENNRKILKLNIDSEDEVYSYADKNRFKVVDIKERKTFLKGRKLKNKDLKIFSKEMSILLKSGCEISKILRILIDESNDKVRTVLRKILGDIERGNSIKESFENTKAFSSFYISMITAGEMSGNLDDVMDKLAIYYDKENKLRNKIISILIYPTILIITMIISFIFILLFLIPNFEDIYADNNMKTPGLTKILIFLSHLFRDDFLLIIVGNLVLIGGLIYLKKNNDKFNEMINKLIFKLPIIKTYMKLIISNKFIKALSILISSGVQIVDSIETSAKAMSNEYIYLKICKANEFIKKGNSIGDSLKTVEELPSLLLSMITIGEESGKLDTVLNTVTEYYENELDSKLEIGTKYFENFITLFIGVVVGIIVISMMVPMFDAVSAI